MSQEAVVKICTINTPPFERASALPTDCLTLAFELDPSTVLFCFVYHLFFQLTPCKWKLLIFSSKSIVVNSSRLFKVLRPLTHP